jgi:hypothetical protein
MAHSTYHPLRSIVRHVKGRRESPLSESTGMLLLDVEKAFDTVWHEALLLKLLAKERSFQVCGGKIQSLSCNIPYGMPQGAILSPTLYNYNIFTSDIPNEGDFKLATFADDTTIFVSGKLDVLIIRRLENQEIP